MNDKEILKKAIETFGKDKQMDILIEECNELMTELILYARDKKENLKELASEINDVYIMIEQYEMIVDITALTPSPDVEKETKWNVVQDTIFPLLALQKEVCKRKRGKSHAMESMRRMTDVLLMLEFLKDMLRRIEKIDIDNMIQEQREFKIKRLEGRIEEWNVSTAKKN